MSGTIIGEVEEAIISSVFVDKKLWNFFSGSDDFEEVEEEEYSEIVHLDHENVYHRARVKKSDFVVCRKYQEKKIRSRRKRKKRKKKKLDSRDLRSDFSYIYEESKSESLTSSSTKNSKKKRKKKFQRRKKEYDIFRDSTISGLFSLERSHKKRSKVKYINGKNHDVYKRRILANFLQMFKECDFNEEKFNKEVEFLNLKLNGEKSSLRFFLLNAFTNKKYKNFEKENLNKRYKYRERLDKKCMIVDFHQCKKFVEAKDLFIRLCSKLLEEKEKFEKALLIVGKGKGSKGGIPVIKNFVIGLCEKCQFPCFESPTNSGIVMIGENIEEFDLGMRY